MDMEKLSTVVWGDKDGLSEFLFENSVQHKLFRNIIADQGVQIPAFPLADAEIEDIDDWLLSHQVEHQAMSAQLNLSNPFNLLDADWSIESDFYEWIASHYSLHRSIVSALGLQL